MKIGLCLSGGGARGSFHIGVLRALEEKGIRPCIVSGTSAGALVGSMYCAGMDSESIFRLAENTRWYHFLGAHIPDSGLVPMKFLEKMLKEKLPAKRFEDLSIPFICTASNMDTGKLHYYETGELIGPVLASCAIPIVFKPVILDGATCLDGGILMNLPAEVIRNRCDLLIASNLIPSYEIGHGKLVNVSKIMSRLLELSIINTMKDQIHFVDIMIENEDIKQYGRFNLKNASKLYELGYEAAIGHLQKAGVT